MIRALDLSTPGGITLGLLPEIVLTVATLAVLVVVGLRHRTAADSRLAGILSLGALGLSGVALAWMWASGMRAEGLAHMMALDGFRYASSALFLLLAAGTILLSLGYLEREQLLAPEFYPLVLLATVGMMLLGGGSDLIVIFLGLETMSVAVYCLAGYDRRDAVSSEAALKYFLIGAFASGFLLYGIALVYGATGQTNLDLIAAHLGTNALPLFAKLGLGMLLIGFGFKVAAVPFHMWAPDAYDGAPTPVAGFMATAVKAAGFVALVRIINEGFPRAAAQWQPAVAALAIVTMIVGNLVALNQRSVKRMLAYSSVAHAGYVLVGVWAGTQLGAAAVLVYLFAYGLTTLASFGLLAGLGRDGERDVTIDRLAGLAQTRPWAARGLTVCMLSLLGFPGTFGFIGKFNLMRAVVDQGQLLLPVFLVVTSVVSAGYYLPLIRSMYMQPAAGPEVHAGVGFPRLATAAIAISVGAVIVLGILPGGLLEAALRSVEGLGAEILAGR